MENYYIGISKFWFILWLVLGIIFTLLSVILFPILIIPLCYYFILKNRKYYYNDEKMIIEEGVLNKKQFIVPLYRIVNIRANDNMFNFGKIYIQDKSQMITLKDVKNAKMEMMNLIEKWENAKKNNIRNEVI